MQTVYWIGNDSCDTANFQGVTPLPNGGVSPHKNSENSINRTPSMKVLLTEQELEWQPWKVHRGYPRGFTENWNRMFAAEVTGKSDWPQAAWTCLINWLNSEDLGAWERLLSKLNALKLKDACISAQGAAVI